jgi:hypothetical protein
MQNKLLKSSSLLSAYDWLQGGGWTVISAGEDKNYDTGGGLIEPDRGEPSSKGDTAKVKWDYKRAGTGVKFLGLLFLFISGDYSGADTSWSSSSSDES